MAALPHHSDGIRRMLPKLLLPSKKQYNSLVNKRPRHNYPKGDCPECCDWCQPRLQMRTTWLQNDFSAQQRSTTSCSSETYIRCEGLSCPSSIVQGPWPQFLEATSSAIICVERESLPSSGAVWYLDAPILLPPGLASLTTLPTDFETRKSNNNLPNTALPVNGGTVILHQSTSVPFRAVHWHR